MFMFDPTRFSSPVCGCHDFLYCFYTSYVHRCNLVAFVMGATCDLAAYARYLLLMCPWFYVNMYAHIPTSLLPATSLIQCIYIYISACKHCHDCDSLISCMYLNAYRYQCAHCHLICFHIYIRSVRLLPCLWFRRYPHIYLPIVTAMLLILG